MKPELGELASSRRDGILVLRLSGEFDLSNAWKIRDALTDAVGAEPSEIVVDLGAVRFMDAQLLRSLINARGAAAARGITLRVLPPSDPDVRRVAELIDFPLAA